MADLKKVLIIGPFPPPITGNGLSNKVVYEGAKEKEDLIADKISTSSKKFDESVGSFSFKKVFNAVCYNLKIHKVARADVLYITPGQSFFGIVKYAFFIIIAKLYRKKIIVHIHGNFLHQEYDKLKKTNKMIAKKLIGAANSGIVLSKSLKKNLSPFLADEKIETVNNFFEDYLAESIEDVLENKSLEKLKIIYLSNLMLEKGIMDLLSAIELLQKNNINYEAKIAGNIDVKIKDNILKKISELQHVTYLGVVESEKKKNLLLWGNVFVFPTYYKMEGQPIALIEAMVTGNVLLSTNHAGIPEIFSEKNGCFIKKRDPQDIYQKLIKIQNNSNYYQEIIKHNHLYAKKKFKKELFLDKILEIITR